jgi:membrane peptidoglycan carboxypeptidase
MVKYNYIEKEKAEVAKAMEIKFKGPAENITAPHFVMYIKEQLAEKYGEKEVEQGGLKIITTLDLHKQKIAEEIIGEIAPKNEKNYNAKNASLVSLDPKTGQILAMVGSRDYFDEKNDGQVNVAIRPRQPGSSIKPLVYAAAFLKGYTPNTVLYDVITNFSTDPAKAYEPHNYDNKEHGPVIMRVALAGSLNIPAVKTIYLAGINKVLDLALDLGYTTLIDRDRFGLSLVLGGGEVKLLEHANAFSAFARDGELQKVSGILKIEDKNGKTIEEFKENKKVVLEANVARMINDILSDNNARAFVFGPNNKLTLPNRPVAAKTGTTNDYRDAWTIGYTPSLVAGVWVGNNNNSSMKRGADGSIVAAPIWNEYMKRVLGDTPVEQFKKPAIPKTGKPVLDGDAGIKKIKIDKASGLLATQDTPLSFIEEISVNEPHCILYYLDKNNPRGDVPGEPQKDPQFSLWESRVRSWAEKQGLISSTSPAVNIPTDFDNVHKAENKPLFNIKNLSENQTLNGPNILIEITATAPRGINRAEYYLDDYFLSSNLNYPFNLNKNISFIKSGYHSLLVRVCDDIDNCSEQKLNFNLAQPIEPKTDKIGIRWETASAEIASSSLPLNFILKTSNTAQIAKINIFQKQAESIKLIKAVNSPENDFVSFFWPNIISPSTFFAEALGWNGQKVKSDEITIKIVN